MRRAFALTTLFVLTACVTPEPGPAPPPGLDDLTPGVWNAVPLADGAVCADGSAYRIHVRPGDPERLLVDFEGGGACWNPFTCRQPFDDGDPGLYRARVGDDPATEGLGGIYDHARPDNPFGGWTHVRVSYCTGDVHWGDARRRYDPLLGDAFDIEHRGAVNARVALGWTTRELPAPERVAVVGCSAGAFGSIVWTPRLRRAYPDASFVQLADAGIGIVGEPFLTDDDGIRRWAIEGALADTVPALDPDRIDPYRTVFFREMYLEIARAFPGIRLAQHSTDLDAVQTLFFELTGGGEDPLAVEYALWGAKARASLDAIQAGAPAGSFASYLSQWDDDETRLNGSGHCLLSEDALYDLETDGVLFLGWLETLLDGDMPGPVRP